MENNQNTNVQNDVTKQEPEFKTCISCGNVAPAYDAYCGKCGSQMNTSLPKFCGKCGAKVRMGNIYCVKCGNCIGTPKNNKSNTISPQSRKKIIKFSAIACAIIAVVVIIILNVANSPTKDIVGKWSTKQGGDSKVYEFTKGGKLIFNSFISHDVDEYYFEGTDLVIVDDKEYTFEYSEKAKDDSSYWYIEDDVLYYSGREYYRVD